MKKILSIILILVAIIAFSGLATADNVSAYSVIDKGSYNILDHSYDAHTQNSKVLGMDDWYLIYFDKNHCRFFFTEWKYIYKLVPSYYIDDVPVYNPSLQVWNVEKYNTYGHTVDFKRISKTKIKVTVKKYYKNTLKGSIYYYVKTTKTPYQLQKSKKNYYLKAFGVPR